MLNSLDSQYKSLLDQSLIELVVSILGLKVSDVDFEQNMSAYGFDSITLTQLANQLNHKYQFINLDSVTFLTYGTLAKLSEFLSSQYTEQFSHYFAGPIPVEQVTNETKTPVATSNESPPQVTSRKEVSASQLLESFAPQQDAGVGVSDKNAGEQLEQAEQEIAVIGMAGRFPGAKNVIQLWDNLLAQVNAISYVPDDRWDWQSIFGAPNSNENLTDCCYGGFLQNPQHFDALFFGISPKEAQQMDPQHKLVMQSVWESIESAAYTAEQLRGKNIGVYLGVQRSEMLFKLMHEARDFGPHTNTGNSHSMLANRVSYFYDWIGNSITVDSSCSASSSALHLAYHALLRAEIDLALVGGVTVVQSPFSHIANRKMGLLTNQNQVRSFDKAADGYLIGEGVATVLLKPHQQALADGDFIYGVIKGGAVNQSGKTMFLTAPNPQAHIAVIHQALQDAKLTPNDIDYIEAQGIGTELADKVELQAYQHVFGPSRSQTLKISSIKGNIGHLESASGVTSLIKACMAMSSGNIPAVMHFNELVWQAGQQDLAIEVLARQYPWPNRTDEQGNMIARRAGIHNFGYGGTNAHFVLEQGISSMCGIANDARSRADTGEIADTAQLLVFSSTTPNQLKQTLKDIIEYIEQQKFHYFGLFGSAQLRLADVAYTLRIGRTAMPVRVAVIANSVTELVNKLKGFIAGDTQQGVFSGELSRVSESSVSAQSKPRDLVQAAQQWIAGVQLPDGDWFNDSLTDTLQTKRRIPLPGHQFTQAIETTQVTQATGVEGVEKSADELTLWQAYSAAFADLNQLARRKLTLTMLQWGAFNHVGEVTTDSDLIVSLNVAKAHTELFKVLLSILEREGVITYSQGQVCVVNMPVIEATQLQKRKQTLWV